MKSQLPKQWHSFIGPPEIQFYSVQYCELIKSDWNQQMSRRVGGWVAVKEGREFNKQAWEIKIYSYSNTSPVSGS